MKIEYWDCEFENFDLFLDASVAEEVSFYNCTHPNNTTKVCLLANKCGIKVNCRLLEDKL